jgi:glycosyltransferase involved in cell wall biosynthesis
MPSKPRVCFVFPGNLSTPYSTFGVHFLSLIPYLEKDLDISLAFRRVLEPLTPRHQHLEILHYYPQHDKNIFFTPNDIFTARYYLKQLQIFAEEHHQDFDFVVEKPWRLDGSLAYLFTSYGVPSLVLLEAEFHLSPMNHHAFPRTYLQRILWPIYEKQLIAWKKQWLRSIQAVCTETRQMHTWLIEHDYIEPRTPWTELPTGYNPQIFFPQDRWQCRQALGLSQDQLVLVYVGSLNCYIHDPVPLLQALGSYPDKEMVVYLIGDGKKRLQLEEIVFQYQIPAIFPGRLSQREVAQFIGASDLCLAPYNIDFYPDQCFTSASLKVVEYLACGRPVLTIPCERMRDLTASGRYGCLVENRVSAYSNFFQQSNLQTVVRGKEDRLRADLENGVLQEQGIVVTFADVATRYLQIIQQALS